MQEALVDGWIGQPQFSAATLAPLHHLNHRFLDLLAEESEHWGERTAECMTVARTLRALQPTQLEAAARCPYALFDLRLDDAEHWRRRLAHPVLWRIEERAAPSESAAFTRLALFYAWHVAASERPGAELLLGMHAQTADALRATRLVNLPSIAGGEATLLRPRFPERRAFWSALARAALRGDAGELRRVQLFGLQLSAAVRLS